MMWVCQTVWTISKSWRVSPTTSSDVVAMVETGKPVTVVCRTEGQSVTSSAGSTNQWLRVTVGELAGYVSALYVDTDDDIYGAETETAYRKTA